MVKTTLGVIFGNRGFFPDVLIGEARKEVCDTLGQLDIDAVMLGDHDTKLGGVETLADARRCAELFRRSADAIDGLLVCLPNFGDERGVAETIKQAKLNVPVLIQACPDEAAHMSVDRRRDAYCGKISVCNNLHQADIPFSLTDQHAVSPAADSFKADLQQFAAVCRVVNGMRGARLGAIGARPAAFNTVRFSEKILEANGISVTPVDWSELMAAARGLADGDERVVAKVNELSGYTRTASVPELKMLTQAKLGVIIDEWIAANDIDATAIQCWTSVQENMGVSTCGLMSMMSQYGKPSACEVDVMGALTMLAFQLASGVPSALADWNNNYGDDPDKCVLFHCGNWPMAYLPDGEMTTMPILENAVGKDVTWGTMSGRPAPAAVTFGRLSTDDALGEIRGYLGRGDLTDDPLETFGALATMHVPGLNDLMRFVCREGFEHHATISLSDTSDALREACVTYLGWPIHEHGVG